MIIICNSDIYSVIISFIKIHDVPVISRKYLINLIHKLNLLNNYLPVLVDIKWHTSFPCKKYCVCKIATKKDRIEYYYKNLSNKLNTYYLQ